MKKSKKRKKARKNYGKKYLECQVEEEHAVKKRSEGVRGALEVEGVGVIGEVKEESLTGSHSSTKLPSLTEARRTHDAFQRHAAPVRLMDRPVPASVSSRTQSINSLNVKSPKHGSCRGGNNRSNQNIAGLQGKKSRSLIDMSLSAPAVVKTVSPADSSCSSGQEVKKPCVSSSPVYNETFRWNNTLDDSDEERERIRTYKLNRRKRYLAAAQSKGLSWTVNYSITSGFQISDDHHEIPTRGAAAPSYTNFGTIRSLRPGQGILGHVIVKC